MPKPQPSPHGAAAIAALHGARPQPLPLLRRVTLLLISTPIAQTGTISMIDSLSPHLIGGLLELCIHAGKKACELR